MSKDKVNIPNKFLLSASERDSVGRNPPFLTYPDKDEQKRILAAFDMDKISKVNDQ